MLSALWFPPEARTRATGFGYASTQVGACLAPLWYSIVKTRAQLHDVLYAHFAIAVALSMCCFFAFPSRIAPAHTAADAQQEYGVHQLASTNNGDVFAATGSTARLGFGPSVNLLRSDTKRWVPCLLLAFIGALSNAAVYGTVGELPILFKQVDNTTDVAMAVSHPQLLRRGVAALHATRGGGQLHFALASGHGSTDANDAGEFGPAAGPGPGNGPGNGSTTPTPHLNPLAHLTQHDGNIMGFFGMLSYAIASPVGGAIADRWFQQNLKFVILLSLLFGTVVNILLFILLPSPLHTGLLSWDGTAPDTIYWLLFTWTIASCSSVGMMMGPLIELLAEIAYPASESLTITAMILLVQFVGIPVPAMVPHLPKHTAFQYMQLVVVVVMLVCVALCLAVHQTYNRRLARQDTAIRAPSYKARPPMPPLVIEDKAVVFDFDKCLMKSHWWARHKNNPLATINPQPEDFGHSDIGGLFRRLLGLGVTVCVASFGRHDVIKKAIRATVPENLAARIFVTTPRDFEGFRDGGSMGAHFKNSELGLICETFSLQPEDVVFFDDSKDNIKHARLYGCAAHVTMPFVDAHESLITDHLGIDPGAL